MAQRYPQDFDGIFSRVPVIHWTGLQHAGLRDGIATSAKGGWIGPAQVKLVHDAVLAPCDAADGVADGIVSTRSRAAALRSGQPALHGRHGGDNCLTDAQVQAVQTLHSPWRSAVPNWPTACRVSRAAAPAAKARRPSAPPAAGNAWWTGTAAPTFPPVPANGIAWFYGSGRDPVLLCAQPEGRRAQLPHRRPRRRASRPCRR
jgi:hypothetical protein